MAKKMCEICGERPATVPDRIALGWANGWTDEPQIVKDCKAENHPSPDPRRGLEPLSYTRFPVSPAVILTSANPLFGPST